MFPGERWASPGYVMGSGEMVTKTGGIVLFHLDAALIHHHVLSVGHGLGPSRLCDLLNILNLINDRRKARFQNTQTDGRTDRQVHMHPILQSVVSPGLCRTSTIPQKRIDSKLFDVPCLHLQLLCFHCWWAVETLPQ